MVHRRQAKEEKTVIPGLRNDPSRSGGKNGQFLGPTHKDGLAEPWETMLAHATSCS